jgi:demethylmenaquinone methyltransferase / 2-methoxy-6-polyprenyl-1,4-benzoquinol methylase
MDSYTISFGIRNVTNRDKALTEALRVLKPGGRFMCMEFTPMDTPIIKDVYEAYSMNVVPMMGQAIANDADSYRCALPVVYDLASVHCLHVVVSIFVTISTKL